MTITLSDPPSETPANAMKIQRLLNNSSAGPLSQSVPSESSVFPADTPGHLHTNTAGTSVSSPTNLHYHFSNTNTASMPHQTQNMRPLNSFPGNPSIGFSYFNRRPAQPGYHIPEPEPPLVNTTSASSLPHRHPREGNECGYFGAGSYFSPAFHYQTTTSPETQYHYGQQNTRYETNALLSLAETAVEDSTPAGRRSLEIERATVGSTDSRRNSELVRGSEVSFELSNERHGADRRRDMVPHGSAGNIDIDPTLQTRSRGSTTRAAEHPEVSPTSSCFRNPLAIPTEPMIPLFRASPDPTGVCMPSSAEEDVAAVLSPHEFLSHPPTCSYCNACATNSPLRKVVSHIFGRNKLSTRQIPKNVWVYYCRKHYQRSRYRNPRGFARQQVLLVRRQCQRLDLWGGVKDWIIKIRRREELRLSRKDTEIEVEDVDEADDGTGGDDEMEDLSNGGNSRRYSNIVRRMSSVSGLSTNWITAFTGPEKTITDVYKLLDHIEAEVSRNGGKFPDVELLPNVDLSLAIVLDAQTSSGSCHVDGDDDNNGRAKKRARKTNSPIIRETKTPKIGSSGARAEDHPILESSSGMGSSYDAFNSSPRSQNSQTATPPPSGSASSTRRGSVTMEEILSSSNISVFSESRQHYQPTESEYITTIATTPRRSSRVSSSPNHRYLTQPRFSASVDLSSNFSVSRLSEELPTKSRENTTSTSSTI